MGSLDENRMALIGQANAQGIPTGNTKIFPGTRHNRPALSNIDPNIIGDQPHRSAVKKRGLSEIRTRWVCDEIPVNPINRPVTRRFAALKANKEQHLAKMVCETNKSHEHNSMNVECYRGIHEDKPMFTVYVEPTLHENDQEMVEVEMADTDGDELLKDIDSSDKMNPLAVVMYIDDLYAHYRKSEILSRVSPNYMTGQPDINEKMRGILVDWLIEVHYKFELMEETLYLTVNLIDRFLAAKRVVRKKLQLVGITAMLLACKYEEVSVPVLEDLIMISDRAYTRKEVLEMEKLMVNSVQFNLSVPTPYVFIRRLLKAAQSNKQLELMSFYMMELCLVESEMLVFSPSLLAASAVFAAQCTLSGFSNWSKTCEYHSEYSQEQLMECSKLMVTFHERAGNGRLTGVYRKYSTSKFGHAACSQPATFLLDNSMYN